MRESDTVARISGDEFTILPEEVADDAAANAALQQISLAPAEGADIHGLPISVEESIGHAIFPDDPARTPSCARPASPCTAPGIEGYAAAAYAVPAMGCPA